MKIKLCTFFTAAYMILFECVHHIFTVASTIIRGRLLAPLHQVWDQYYRGVAFGEAGVFMPHSALSFVINALLAFAAIKSQGVPVFPFQDSPTIHYGLCHQSPHLRSRFCSQTGCLSCRS
ncbi:hypothetical protein HanXRQr2_Chr10g0432691 [Helianthus annuus]|uniref:Uncharacterized protein n=1 Tax=Helianthus annuus TaxID=4232 RepID=A0A251TIP0_HELAN|nr:hypothetical protein HanXRQr2_Chr10g0432691 [Helianthus annuus]